MVYLDTLGEEINQESVPETIFSSAAKILQEPANEIEISHLICLAESVKKIVDAELLDHTIGLWFERPRVQEEIFVENTLPELLEYVLYLVGVEKVKLETLQKTYIEYVKIKTYGTIPLSEALEAETPIIMVRMIQEETSEYVWDGQVVTRIQELFSRQNPGRTKISTQENQKQGDQKQGDKKPQEDILNYLEETEEPEESEDEFYFREAREPIEEEEVIESAYPKLANDQQGPHDNKEYFELFKENIPTMAKELYLDDGIHSYSPENTKYHEGLSPSPPLSPSASNSPLQTDNFFDSEAPSSPPTPSESHYEPGNAPPPPSDLILVLPSPTPYFPHTLIRNFAVRNPVIQQAVLRLYTHSQDVPVVLFFAKIRRHALVTSENDLHHVGVFGHVIRCYHTLEILLLDIATFDRVQIKELALPNVTDWARALGVNLDQLVTLARVSLKPYADLTVRLNRVHCESRVRKYTGLALETLRRMLRVFQDVNVQLQQFRYHFEEAFEEVYARYSLFGELYGEKNVMDFFKCTQDSTELVLLKTQFLVELLKVGVELKYEHYYKLNKVFRELDNDLYSSLYNNNKKDYYAYYNAKFQGILECGEYSSACKLVYKAIKAEETILKYEGEYQGVYGTRRYQQQERGKLSHRGSREYFSLGGMMGANREMYYRARR